MCKNVKILFFLFYCCSFYCQEQIHIKYQYVRSAIAQVEEDLYFNGVDLISIQNENILFFDKEVPYTKKYKPLYFISSFDKNGVKKNNSFFTAVLNGEDIFVLDEVPNLKWLVDQKTNKTILGFKCIKATTVFRGSTLTAYFSEEIPLSIGPFKFSGLPGAILEIRVDNQNYDIWKAIKVDLKTTKVIDFKPKFPSFTKLKIKDWIELQDKANDEYSNSIPTPNGSTSQVIPGRLVLEKKYEWE